jgi:AraC family transcriptional activator of pobA
MFFIAPNQVMGFTLGQNAISPSGWMLLIHPDFLWNTSLVNITEKYEFFDYSVNEALFLSEKEEAVLDNIIDNIEQEYHSNIDKFSKQIVSDFTIGNSSLVRKPMTRFWTGSAKYLASVSMTRI